MIQEMLSHPEVEQILVNPTIITHCISATWYFVLHPEAVQLLDSKDDVWRNCLAGCIATANDSDLGFLT